MSAQRRRRRRAPGQHRLKRGGRAENATPPERSRAAVDSDDDPIEQAVATLAAELPALVTTAVLRAKRGKPATLLRSVHRMVRELDQMIALRRTSRPREWERLKNFGPLSGREALILGNMLELLRSTAPAEENPHPVWTPERIRAAQQEHDAAATVAEREQPDPTSTADGSATPSYAGAERRSRPASTFFGKHERRKHRP